MYTATFHSDSKKGHDYEWYTCDTCGEIEGYAPYNRVLSRFLYFITFPLKIFGLQDKVVDRLME